VPVDPWLSVCVYSKIISKVHCWKQVTFIVAVTFESTFCQVIEINDPKKLMAIYDELSARLTTVIDFELPLLQKDIDERTSTEATHHRQRHASDVPQIVIEYITTLESPTINGTSVTSSTSQRTTASNPDGSTVNRPLLQQPSIESVASSGGLLTKMLGKSISKSPSAELPLATSTTPSSTAAAAGGGDGSRSARGTSVSQGSNLPMSLLVRPKLLWKVS
jgi:hypothetical protein